MAPVSRPRRGWYWTAVVVAAVVFVAAGVLALVSDRDDSGPDGAVRGYFSALAAGDAAGALGYGALPAGSRQLLTATVLREQLDTAPISGLKVLGVDYSGSTATVTVDYTLGFSGGARQVEDSVHTVHRGGHWQLSATATLTRLNLLQAVDRASILGSALPTGSVLVFPGALPIGFDTSTLQLAAGTDSVGLSSPAQTTLTVQVSSSGRTQILATLSDQLTACLKGTGASPSCPVPSSRVVPGSLTGTFSAAAITALPVGVTNDPTGVIEIDGASVTVTGSYEALDFDNLPVHKTGTIALPLTAMIYATSPLTFVWNGAGQ